MLCVSDTEVVRLFHWGRTCPYFTHEARLLWIYLLRLLGEWTTSVLLSPGIICHWVLKLVSVGIIKTSKMPARSFLKWMRGSPECMGGSAPAVLRQCSFVLFMEGQWSSPVTVLTHQPRSVVRTQLSTEQMWAALMLRTCRCDVRFPWALNLMCLEEYRGFL